MNEELLTVKEILDGKTERYEELMMRYRNVVGAIVGRRVPARNAPDVIQDVFVRAFRSLDGYAGNSPFGNWLSRIAVRTCCDFWRRQERQGNMLTAPTAEQEREWLELVSSDAATNIFESEDRRKAAEELLTVTMARLDAEDRALIEMIYFEELPLKEAAAIMEWGLPKTKVRAMRARHKMKKIIKALTEKR